MDKKRGFTLVELMVVVAILGILLLMVFPSLSSATDFNAKNRVNTTNKIILSAIDSWSRDNIVTNMPLVDLNSINSQGKRVYQYISNNEIFTYTNLSKQNSGSPSEFLVISSLNDPNTVKIDLQYKTLKVSYIDKDGLETQTVTTHVQ